jgi:hypothetical protein
MEPVKPGDIIMVPCVRLDIGHTLEPQPYDPERHYWSEGGWHFWPQLRMSLQQAAALGIRFDDNDCPPDWIDHVLQDAVRALDDPSPERPTSGA